MSAIPTGDSEGERLLLGRILVAQGLLTEEQIAGALAEGQRTGEQIGAVIVRLELLPAATIAQALATQSGGVLKTEYGFAVGFNPDGGPPQPPITAPPAATPTGFEVPAAPLGIVSPSEQAAEATYPAVLPAFETVPVPPLRDAPDEETTPQPAPVNPELNELRSALHAAETAAGERATLEVCLQAANAKVGTLEADLAALSSAKDQLEEELRFARVSADRLTLDNKALKLSNDETGAAEIAMLEVRLEELQQQLDSHESLERQLAVATEALRTAEADRAALFERVGELEDLSFQNEREQTHEDVHGANRAHLLFVPGTGRYDVVERVGPPPAPGEIVELGGAGPKRAKHLVIKVTSATLPDRRLLCAYLLEA